MLQQHAHDVEMIQADRSMQCGGVFPEARRLMDAVVGWQSQLAHAFFASTSAPCCSSNWTILCWFSDGKMEAWSAVRFCLSSVSTTCAQRIPREFSRLGTYLFLAFISAPFCSSRQTLSTQFSAAARNKLEYWGMAAVDSAAAFAAISMQGPARGAGRAGTAMGENSSRPRTKRAAAAENKSCILETSGR